MEPVETIEDRGYVAAIYYDEGPESPEGWTQVGRLAYRIRGAGVNAETLPHEDYRMGEHLPADALVVVPVRAWDDRNGTELRVADDWESAQGWIYATAESVAETMGADATGEQVREALVQELAEWQKWAQGEVFGVVVTDDEGNEAASCWGFYGSECAEEEARRMLSDALAARTCAVCGRRTSFGCIHTADGSDTAADRLELVAELLRMGEVDDALRVAEGER